MSKTVEFFFDLSSPWTYLAFHNIQTMVDDNDAQIIWRPFLVGGVFNAVNKTVYAGREDLGSPKMKFFLKSLNDWAAWSGLPLNFPSKYHPVKSVYAMRCCCVLESDQNALRRFATACFKAYFEDEHNIDDPDILMAIANSCSIDSKWLAQEMQSDTAKLALRNNTQEAIERGSFGSPSIFVGQDMYFGNDQLPLVKRAIKAI